MVLATQVMWQTNDNTNNIMDQQHHQHNALASTMQQIDNNINKLVSPLATWQTINNNINTTKLVTWWNNKKEQPKGAMQKN